MAQATAQTEPRQPDADPRGSVDVSVVAPAYNEADNLTALVEEITAAMDGEGYGYEIVLVDDGSTDDTQTAMYHLAELFDEVRCIQLKRNYGQSHALQAGLDAAGGEYVVTLDADLQNDPAEIPRLLQKLKDADVDCVSGRRADRQDGLAKRIPSTVQTHLAKHTAPGIHDFGCTLKAYRREAVADITLYGESHRYIPAKLHAKGHRIVEVDVNHRPRENGSSHYGAGRLVRGFVDLVWHWFWVRYGTRPMHVFGGLGLVCMALAGLGGAWSVVDRFVFGTPLLPHLPRLVAIVGLGLFGLVLFVFGVLAEMVVKLHHDDSRPYRVKRVIE